MGKAFDSVWHEGLIFKLTQINLPYVYVHLVWSFLQARSFACRVNEDTSSSRPCLAGVAQGAINSPTLYAISTYDIPLIKEGLTCTYADDHAVAVTGQTPEEIATKLQKYMDELDRWAARWRIQYNADKTVGVYFTRKRQTPNINVSLNGCPVQWKTEAKYLGVMLDRKILWKPHINLALRKGRATLSLLYSLISHRSQMSLKNKVHLFTAVIRPCSPPIRV